MVALEEQMMTSLTDAMASCLNQACNSHEPENAALKASGSLAGEEFNNVFTLNSICRVPIMGKALLSFPVPTHVRKTLGSVSSNRIEEVGPDETCTLKTLIEGKLFLI